MTGRQTSCAQSRDTSDSEVPSLEQERNSSRLHLLLDVLVFQFKLAADGLRDLLLSPLSILSVIIGLIAGGNDPYKYFRKLLRLGRRSEIWLNLFGLQKRAGTSDDLITPITERVMAEAQSNPWIAKAGGELNKKLDNVGERINSEPGTSEKPGD